METKEKQYKILELLARHERSIGELYKIFAEKFSDMEEFWNKIASEEKVHALWIENLKPKIEDSSVYLDIKKFTEQSLNNSLEYLEQEKTDAKEKKYDQKRALSTARQIESALIDSKNLELFATDSAESKHFLDFLKEETKKHIEMIQKEAAKNQG